MILAYDGRYMTLGAIDQSLITKNTIERAQKGESSVQLSCAMRTLTYDLRYSPVSSHLQAPDGMSYPVVCALTSRS